MKIFSGVFFLILSIFVVYNVMTQKYSDITNVFQICVLLAFFYESGYVKVFKRGGVAIFFVLFVTPILISLLLIFFHYKNIFFDFNLG